MTKKEHWGGHESGRTAASPSPRPLCHPLPGVFWSHALVSLFSEVWTCMLCWPGPCLSRWSLLAWGLCTRRWWTRKWTPFPPSSPQVTHLPLRFRAQGCILTTGSSVCFAALELGRPSACTRSLPSIKAKSQKMVGFPISKEALSSILSFSVVILNP